ncbi:uncharacterized protein V6R79_002714 [Siganus canaliculatus]
MLALTVLLWSRGGHVGSQAQWLKSIKYEQVQIKQQKNHHKQNQILKLTFRNERTLQKNPEEQEPRGAGTPRSRNPEEQEPPRSRNPGPDSGLSQNRSPVPARFQQVRSGDWLQLPGPSLETGSWFTPALIRRSAADGGDEMGGTLDPVRSSVAERSTVSACWREWRRKRKS